MESLIPAHGRETNGRLLVSRLLDELNVYFQMQIKKEWMSRVLSLLLLHLLTDSSRGGDDGGQRVSETTFCGNSTLLFLDCPRLVSERFLESVEFRCIFRSFVWTSPRVLGAWGDFRLHRVNFHSMFSRTSWIS